MPRQHPDASPNVACIWPANSTLNDEIAQRLICWAGPENVTAITQPTFHYEVPKALCSTNGPLTFTDGGPNQCPLGDDLTVSTATSINPTTCTPAPPPGSTEATQEGNNDFTGTNSFANTTSFQNINVSGTTSITDLNTPGTITINAPDDTTESIIINQDATVDPSTSADLIQINYKTARAGWFNEWGGLRVRVPAIADLGYSDNCVKLFEQIDGTADGLQIFAPADGSTPSIRSRGGILYAKNILESVWTPIIIDSPQTAGKYTAQTNGTAGFNSPQVRIVNGGKTAELRGRINSVTTGGVTDEIIATTLPTSIALGSGTVSAVPLRKRGFMAQGSGGGIRLTLATNGNLQILGSANTQPEINLDGITYSLEL